MINLMAAFEFYLLATFFLGTVQLRHHAAAYRLVFRTPARWPKLYAMLKENLNAVLTLPTMTVFGLMLGTWLLHTFFRRLMWPDAVVTPEELASKTVLVLLASVSGLLMLLLDLRALFRATRFRPPRMVWLLDLTELGLKTEAFPIRWLVRWRLRSNLAARLPLLRRWMWKRSGEIAARFAFGTTLWATWLLDAG